MSTPNASLYYSNNNNSTSTLRPRNTRLISYLDEEANTTDTSTATSSSTSAATPLFPDREPSPAVSRNRSRDKASSSANASASQSRKASSEVPRGANNDIWSSWSSIASSLLGGEASTAKGKGRATPVQPKWMKQDRTHIGSPTTSKWGPKGSGAGQDVANSLEDRQALLQAKRRQALLLGSVEPIRDSSGRVKRRDSDDGNRIESSPVEEDALVYVHKIRREDTLAGVMLKYGCQPDVFRKVNRFWPNDNIQVRNHVFLPVEACTIRGKKVDGPHAGLDLLGPAIEDLAKTTKPGKGALKRMGTPSLPSTPAETDSPASEPFPSYTNNDNPDLKHDSWVAVPNFPDPIAILRIPRSSLGYFPRARRKSLIHSELSQTSTPRSSFDTLRHPPSHAAQMSLQNAQSSHIQSLTSSPVRRPHLNPHQSAANPNARQRSSSTTSSIHSVQQPWTSLLTGPGGVGTLRGLRTEPSRPGPAEDTLNRTFKTYFPDLAITNTTDPTSHPQRRLSGLFPPPRTASHRTTPRASMDSVRSARSNSSGLVDVAGGVEGWMRKIATVNKRAKGVSGGVAAVGGATGMEDLIELEVTAEEGVDEEDVRTPTMGHVPSMGLPAVEAREDVATMGDAEGLDERFPVRGRVKTAYEKGR